MKRDCSIDFAAGLMIVSMILMHIRFFSGSKWCSFLTDLFPFYMAWFYYKSGMFYKERNWSDTLKNGYSKLIRPFLIFSVVGFVLYLILNGTVNWKLSIKEFVMLGSFPGSQHLWFLVSLFLALCLFKLVRNYWWAIAALCVLLLLFHYNAKKHLVGFPIFGDIPYLWGNIMAGCLFMYCGYRLRKYQYLHFVFFVSLFLYAVMFMLCYSSVDMHTMNITVGGLQWYLFSIFGIVALNNLSKYIVKYVVSQPLIYIGKYSLQFYIYHWFVILCVCIVCKWLKMDVAAYILILANLVLLPAIVELQKKCFAKRQSEDN
ncbi:MAG: acyltransferase family protein [Prevotella sp.]|nr:acyltransferase family protein [Prevotella sp.]